MMIGRVFAQKGPRGFYVTVAYSPAGTITHFVSVGEVPEQFRNEQYLTSKLEEIGVPAEFHSKRHAGEAAEEMNGLARASCT